MQNISHTKILIISFIVVILFGCSKTKSNQVDAWLFEVIDNYPLPILNNSLFSVNYPRVIQFKYMIKNNTSDTLFVPINVVNGYNTFHSRIKMGIGTHYFNNLLDQKLTMGKNDVILAPNGQTSVTITLYSQDIKCLHLKKNVSLGKILRRVSFRYFYSNSDISHYSPIELIFHNSNETDWIDIKDIKEEREKQWNVHYDSLRNILLVNYIPMTRIREVEGAACW